VHGQSVAGRYINPHVKPGFQQWKKKEGQRVTGNPDRLPGLSEIAHEPILEDAIAGIPQRHSESARCNQNRSPPETHPNGRANRPTGAPERPVREPHRRGSTLVAEHQNARRLNPVALALSLQVPEKVKGARRTLRSDCPTRSRQVLQGQQCLGLSITASHRLPTVERDSWPVAASLQENISTAPSKPIRPSSTFRLG